MIGALPTSRFLLALILGAGFVAASPAAAQTSEPAGADVFGQIGHWFDQSMTSIGDQFKNAGKGVDNFGREAGIAARTTTDAATDAAGAMARIPSTRIVSGHENCLITDNGAPDCRSAIERLCKSKGMSSGRSLDITAAEECPVRVMLGQRERQPGECKNVTFVSRAVCQ